MNISENGIKLIQSFESYSAKPYLDSAGIWTIGYGTTYYNDGTRVCKDDDYLSQEEAVEQLKSHLQSVEDVLVGYTLTQNQYDALCSFIYNVGISAFKNSTMCKFLKLGNTLLASVEFPKWNKAGGKVLKGLSNRRQEEQRLFLKG